MSDLNACKLNITKVLCAIYLCITFWIKMFVIYEGFWIVIIWLLLQFS